MINKVDLEPLLEKLEATRALDDLQDVIVAVRRAFCVDHMVYHWVDSAGEQYGCGTYPVEWVDRYVQKNYQRVDPVIIGCYRQFHPVDWKRLDWSSKAAQRFRSDAQAHGVGNQGYSVPIRGPMGQFALFTVSHDCDDDTWATFVETHSRGLILTAHYFNRKALEFAPNRLSDQARTLSPREIDAMTLLAVGYSRAQTADALSISEHTLRVYIESARFKLGALNNTHAVARAVGSGLIVV